MACKYTYKGAEYTEEEFRKVLKSMPRPELQKYVPSATVPSAPFVTSTDAWVELGLKQAIRMAVEGGPSPAWADATKPKSIREEFDNHLSPELASVLPLEVVNASVLAASKNDEVRRAIVAAIPVDVVNILSKHGVSPESLLTKSDVFGKSIPVVSRPAVARGLADALQLVGARLRATLDGELSLEPTRSNGKPLAAVSARDFSPDVVVGLLSPSRIYGSKELGRDVPLAAASRTGSGAEAPGAKTAKVKLAGESRELGSAELAVALNRHDAILRNSADNSKKYDPGYEVISWTTGTQQNERYDLSKQVDSIEWETSDEVRDDKDVRMRNIIVSGSGTGMTIGVTEDGIVRSGGGIAAQSVGKRLDEVVGKDMADKIMSEESGDLSGDGLKVGGSGMKGFYDKILPIMAGKVGKKLGGDGKVQPVTLGTPKDAATEIGTQQSMAITPAMRQQVGGGVPMMHRPDPITAQAERYKAAGYTIEQAKAHLEGRNAKPEAVRAVLEKMGENNNRPKRRLTQRVFNDPSINDEVKDAFTEDAIFYDRIPHSLSKGQAQALLAQMTDKEAEDAVLDTTNRMHLAVRFLLGIELMRRYQTNQDYDGASSFYNKFVPMTTEAGQGVAALRELGAVMGKRGLLEQAKRDVGRDLTPQEQKKLEELAERVEKAAEGRPKYEATEDFLKYQAQLKGMDWWEIPLAIWYANMLSGPITHLKNFVANAANATLLYAGAVAQNPRNSVLYAKAVIHGTRRGILEAGAVWNTGYSPIRGKVEIPPVLERLSKSNPFSYLKYVRRAMVVADIVFFEGLKEMRAYQHALKEAAKSSEPSMPRNKQIDKALELLNERSEVYQKAQAQAQQEYEAEVAQAKNAQERRTAKRNRARRVFELVENGRSEEMKENMHSFAARGTHNYKPEGFLGLVAETLNKLGSKAPAFRLVVPFTNIIANIANDAINYTPAGAIRGAMGRQTFGKHNTAPLTDQERADLYTKAAIGTALMVAAYILSQPGDDDEEPFIEITANGTGDFQKNEELRRTGWQPYSVKIGDQWISYQYTPMLLGLGYIGNIRDFEKYRDGKLTDNALTRFTVPASWATSTMLDQTFLSSLDNFLSAITDERNEDKTKAAIKGLSNTARTFVVPNLYTQTAAKIMEHMQIPEKNVQGDHAFLGRMLRDIPVARNAHEDKVNALGDYVYPDRTTFVSSEKDDPVWKLVAEKKAFIGAPSRNTSTIIDPKTRKERLMTDKEYFEFAQARGKMIRAGLEANLNALKDMEPEKVRKYLTKLKGNATKGSKAMLWQRLAEDGD